MSPDDLEDRYAAAVAEVLRRAKDPSTIPPMIARLVEPRPQERKERG